MCGTHPIKVFSIRIKLRVWFFQLLIHTFSSVQDTRGSLAKIALQDTPVPPEVSTLASASLASVTVTPHPAIQKPGFAWTAAITPQGTTARPVPQDMRAMPWTADPILAGGKQVSLSTTSAAATQLAASLRSATARAGASAKKMPSAPTAISAGQDLLTCQLPILTDAPGAGVQVSLISAARLQCSGQPLEFLL